MMNVLAIAAGGALGAVMRHGVNMLTAGMSFPWGTLFVNVTGSLIMGILVGAFALFWDAPQALRAFLTVGVLGGFTTFSSFSMESVLLLEKGQVVEGVSYILASVLLSIGGMALGLLLVRMIPA